MHLEYLRTVQAITRLGSFSAAARALHLSQPAVSLQVKELERHFGLPLFERAHGPLHLTAGGRQVLPLLEECLTAYEGALLAASAQANRGSVLRVAAGVTGVEYTVPALLAPFMKTHPHVGFVFVTVRRTGEVAAEVARRQADVGFTTGHHGVPRRTLVQYDLPEGLEEVVLVVAPHHPWAARTRAISLEEMTAEPFIFRDAESSTTKAVRQHLNELGCLDRLHVRMELNSNEAVKSTVRASLGVTLLPLQAVAAELQSGSLVRVAVEGLDIRRRWCLLYRKGEESPRALRELLAFFEGQGAGEG